MTKDDAYVTERLGQYVMSQSVAVAHDTSDVGAPFAGVLGITVRQIIACALRNPEWGHWWRIADELLEVPEYEIALADRELMEIVAVGGIS